MRRTTVTHVSVELVDDGLGNTTETTTETTVTGCLLAPRSSSERTDPRAPAVITGATLYLPATATPPVPADYFRIDGTRWDVEGEAGVWPGRGIEVAVKRVS